MGFLYYYPRLKLRVEEMNIETQWMCAYKFGFPPCDSTHESKNLTSIEDFDRSFGTPPESVCEESDAPADDSTSSSSPYPLPWSLVLVVLLGVMF